MQRGKHWPEYPRIIQMKTGASSRPAVGSCKISWRTVSPVLLDATNVTERDRAYSREAASAKGADVVVVEVTAPETLIAKRLKRREQGKTKDGASEAGWDVYRRMKAREQPVVGPHFVVDTSKDIAPSVRKIADKLKSISGN